MHMSLPADLATAPILVADTPEAFALLRDSLDGAFALEAADRLERAKQTVTPHTPLVVCGCHFDEGRMYDLLRFMKSRPDLAGVPFLAVRVLEGQLEDALYESVKIATQALGANGFVDLYRWKLRFGEVQARQRLARCVQELAAGRGAPAAGATAAV